MTTSKARLRWRRTAISGLVLLMLGACQTSSSAKPGDAGTAGHTLDASQTRKDAGSQDSGAGGVVRDAGSDALPAKDSGAGAGGSEDAGLLGADAGTTADAGLLADAGHDSGPSCTTLTVKNYLAWCSVSINGATASAGATQTVCVPAGTVSLSAAAVSSSFELGPNLWHHTAGDTGAGEAGTVTGSGVTAQSATSVSVSGASACVWVCCPFASDGSGCNVSDQCP